MNRAPHRLASLSLPALAPVAMCALFVACLGEDVSSSPSTTDDAGAPTPVADASTPADGGADASDASDASIAARPKPTTNYRTTVMSHGPTAYWRMGTASGTTIPDETGTGNSLILRGSGHTFEQPGAVRGDTALRFDGVASWATPTDSRPFDFPGGEPYTLECWVKRESPATSPGTFEHILGSDEGAPPSRHGYLLALRLVTDAPGAAMTTERHPFDGGLEVGTSGPLADVNVWAHYAVTYDGAKLAMYVNGTLTGTKSTAGKLSARTTPMTIGRLAQGDAYFFKGTLDEIAIYKRALTADEIADDFLSADNP